MWRGTVESGVYVALDEGGGGGEIEEGRRKSRRDFIIDERVMEHLVVPHRHWRYVHRPASNKLSRIISRKKDS